MKPRSKSYFILSYVLFILPPFIWGLVMLYQEGSYDNTHITSLIVNIIIYVILGLVFYGLIKVEKVHLPEREEQKQLLFGFIGNVIIYLYTFQNLLEIDNIVTIYLVLILILFVYYLLIKRTFAPKELWILLPIFLVVDIVHMIYIGCGFNDLFSCYSSNADWFQYLLYWIIFLVSIGYYCYKVYELKPSGLFKFINVSIVLFLSILFQFEDSLDEKLLGTLSILLVFFIILDLIIHVVNKTFRYKYLIFYIRTSTILFIMIFLGTAEEFFFGGANVEMLGVMVAVTYVSLGINILQNLLKVDITNEKYLSNIYLEKCTEEHLKKIEVKFGEDKASHIKMTDKSYSVVALLDEEIIGFISTYVKPLPSPLYEIEDAFINIIEVEESHRRKKVATTLLQKTENHFKNKHIIQIRAWSSNNKLEAIKMWVKNDYTLNPSKIYVKDGNKAVDGYYVSKLLK